MFGVDCSPVQERAWPDASCGVAGRVFVPPFGCATRVVTAVGFLALSADSLLAASAALLWPKSTGAKPVTKRTGVQLQ